MSADGMYGQLSVTVSCLLYHFQIASVWRPMLIFLPWSNISSTAQESVYDNSLNCEYLFLHNYCKNINKTVLTKY